MERGGQKNLLLILARDLAANVATPMFVVDTEGTLVFYNEPAEAVLGQSFATLGEVAVEEWATAWKPEREDGSPLAVDRVVAALTRRTPGYATLRILAHDGIQRTIGMTTIPLFSRVDEFVGATGVFWELEAG